MFLEYLEKGMNGEFVLFNILHNGLAETIKSFTGLQDKHFSTETLQNALHNIRGKERLLTWLKNMPLFYETDTFIFVHAGINPRVADWRLTDEDYSLWDIEDSHRECLGVDNKVVVIGHHHAFRVRKNGIEAGYGDQDINSVEIRTNGVNENGDRHYYRLKSYGNTDEHRPYINGNKIAIDGCTNLTKKVNVLVVEDYEKEDSQPEPDLGSTELFVDKNGQLHGTINGVTYAMPDWYDTITTTITNPTIRV